METLLASQSISLFARKFAIKWLKIKQSQNKQTYVDFFPIQTAN